MCIRDRSTTALVKYVADAHGDEMEQWNGRRIFKEATEGNKLCMEGIDRMVDYLGKGLANICYVANPEVVILGGGIMAVSYTHLDVYKRQLQIWSRKNYDSY